MLISKHNCGENTGMNSSPPSLANLPLHRRIHLAGIVVLVIGVLGALLIYLLAASADGANNNVPDFSADRRFNYEIERVGGKFTVYSSAFNRWLATLWVGTNLAYTVAALSVTAALLCFWLARFMSYPPLDDTPPPRSESNR